MATIQFTVDISTAISSGSPVFVLVTTERLVEPLIQHMPVGRKLWVFDQGTVMFDLVRGIARAIGWVDALGRSMVRQFDPEQATWGIAKWESLLGIEDIGMSLAKRRSNVIGALRARGGQSIAYWTEVMKALGYADVVVTRMGDPFRCGDRCGKRLQGPDWMFGLQFTMTSIAGLDAMTQEMVLAGVRGTTKAKFTFL